MRLHSLTPLVVALACASSPDLLLAQSGTPATKPAATKPAPTTPAKKPAARKPAAKKPAVKKPAPPAPPPPPPRVDLVGFLVMPPDTFRDGPPSGAFDSQGRREAEPRFESQPVQGISSIKPGPTPDTWWALSDNGFGTKWNSSDYHLCIYLFELRARNGSGTDSRAALQAVVELSDPGRHFPWRITREGSEERQLTGADVDPESLVVMPDGTFWIGDEIGPWLLHFSESGELLEPPVEMPDGLLSPLHPAVLAGAAAAKLPRSGGVEGMDLGGDGKTLVVLLEGQVTGDAPRARRILRFDTTTRQWNPAVLSYLLDENVANIGELARIEGDRFVIVERDSLAGDAARVKKVYAIDLARATPVKPLTKKLVIDLLALGNPRGLVEGVPVEGAALRFPYECTESIQVLDRQHVVVVNDNNYPATGGRGAGVRDVTEWLWLELANPL
jgi:hypothetical protein